MILTICAMVALALCCMAPNNVALASNQETASSTVSATSTLLMPAWAIAVLVVGVVAILSISIGLIFGTKKYKLIAYYDNAFPPIILNALPGLPLAIYTSRIRRKFKHKHPNNKKGNPFKDMSISGIYLYSDYSINANTKIMPRAEQYVYVELRNKRSIALRAARSDMMKNLVKKRKAM